MQRTKVSVIATTYLQHGFDLSKLPIIKLQVTNMLAIGPTPLLRYVNPGVPKRSFDKLIQCSIVTGRPPVAIASSWYSMAEYLQVVAGNQQAAGSDAGAWLITGGLGALGTIVARWLAGQGQSNIHLLGRTGRYKLPRFACGLAPWPKM